MTWTFDRPARVGQFVNGDWYVVGPVIVKAISPTPLYGAAIFRSAASGEPGGSKARRAERAGGGSPDRQVSGT